MDLPKFQSLSRLELGNAWGNALDLAPKLGSHPEASFIDVCGILYWRHHLLLETHYQTTTVIEDHNNNLRQLLVEIEEDLSL